MSGREKSSFIQCYHRPMQSVEHSQVELDVAHALKVLGSEKNVVTRFNHLTQAELERTPKTLQELFPPDRTATCT